MDEHYVAIVVTHNRLELLKECLTRLEKQTSPAKKIVVVDNASNDGTAHYLSKKEASDPRYKILRCMQNIGGAGGFEKGLEFVSTSDEEWADCVLLIDDDAILDIGYMEKILVQRQKHTNYQAFAGIVESNGVIDVWHRRRTAKHGISLKQCPAGEYEKEVFECDVVSFCGMVVDMDIIRKVGLPCGEYFIWNDDVEYSFRIRKYTKFLVVSAARLDHRTAEKKNEYPHRRYDWREYYGIRNRLWYVGKHGTLPDRLVNRADMFIRIVFRNWLFGILKMDGYGWEYENALVRKAYRDAKKFQTDIYPEEICEWDELGKSLNTGK